MDRRIISLIVLLFLFAFLLRLPNLFTPISGYFMDNDSLINLSEASNFDAMYLYGHGLLYIILMYLMKLLSVRLFHIIISSLLIPISFVLFREFLGSDRKALLASVILAVTPLFWWLSWVVKPDILMVILVISSLMFYFKGFRTKKSNMIYLGGIFLMLSAMVKVFSLFIIPTVLVYCFCKRELKKRIRELIISFIPVIAYLLGLTLYIQLTFGEFRNIFMTQGVFSVIFRLFYNTLLFSNTFFMELLGIVFGIAFLIAIIRKYKIGAKIITLGLLVGLASTVVFVTVMPNGVVVYQDLGIMHIVLYVMGWVIMLSLLKIALGLIKGGYSDEGDRHLFLIIWFFIFFLALCVTYFWPRYATLLYVPLLLLFVDITKFGKKLIALGFIAMIIVSISLNSQITAREVLCYNFEQGKNESVEFYSIIFKPPESYNSPLFGLTTDFVQERRFEDFYNRSMSLID